jgi:hypothetical protein
MFIIINDDYSDNFNNFMTLTLGLSLEYILHRSVKFIIIIKIYYYY